MKHSIFLSILFLTLFSCASYRKTSTAKESNSNTKITEKKEKLRVLNSNFSGKNSSKINKLLSDADHYLGTPYKYGGNSSAGFDCSGFVCKVYDENGQKIPRRSIDQSKIGEAIEIKNAKPGDLLFFATSGGTTVSHVGIVHGISKDGEITFIHSSTSKGVIISSLNEKYWNKAYLFGRRVW